MARSTRPFPNEKIVVDTGVLFTALVLNFVRMIQVPKEKRQAILERAVAPYLLRDSNLREAFLRRFLQEIRPLRTTAHTIAEIHGLAKTKSRLALHSADLATFWRYSIDFLLATHLDESLVRLTELKDLKEIVCELGPSDTAIIHLAHIEGAVLLTTDAKLMERAKKYVEVKSQYEFASGK